MKFDELNKHLSDQEDYSPKQMNQEGGRLLEEYHKFIDELHKWVQKENVLKVISMISTEKIGTKKFDLANRLDIITSGGKTGVSDVFTFNKDDELLDYTQGPNE